MKFNFDQPAHDIEHIIKAHDMLWSAISDLFGGEIEFLYKPK